jgi:hypothetical protein
MRGADAMCALCLGVTAVSSRRESFGAVSGRSLEVGTLRTIDGRKAIISLV